MVRILSAVVHLRLLALAPLLGFGGLTAVLVAAGELPAWEGGWVAAAALAALAPSGWVAPAGWQRRLAEAGLLPLGFALTLLGDPTMRRFALPPLLVALAWGAAAAALGRAPTGCVPVLVACAAVAVRAAAGLGLTGFPWPLVVAAVVAGAAVSAALAHRWGPRTGLTAALLVPLLPLPQHPWLLLAAGVVVVAALRLPKLGEPLEPLAERWEPLVGSAALVAVVLAPWGGLPLDRLFPDAGWVAGLGALVALVVAGRCPPAVAGAAWLGAACLLGPLQPSPPDLPGVALSGAAPLAPLPAGNGDRYLIDVALANSALLPDDTPVALVHIGNTSLPLLAGEHTAEWAHQRPDVRAAVAHTLPRWAVWRPHGEGREAMWGVGGRVELEVPAGVTPVLERHGELPPEVVVAVASAGPTRPTPPRTLKLPTWLAATALLVALLQLAAGSWRRRAAFLPWLVLATAAALARAPVEPLRLLLERHGVDLCLAALMFAWLPAAQGWLARRRFFLVAATLLVPLAAAAAQLHPPGGDEQYHLIILRSLVEDGDLNLQNNYDLERHPENAIYVTPMWLHSPLLALLLFPAVLLAGRTGALLLLALAGAALLSLVARLAASARLSARAVALATLLTLGSAPLVVFARQIWTEIPGALAAAAAAVLLLPPRPRFAAAAGVAILATGLKTRLGAVAFAPLAAALTTLWRQRRQILGPLLLLLAAVAVALSVSTTIYGHPLGPFRRFGHLLPHNLRQPVTSLLGFIFDAAGGFAFTAPVWLVAVLGVPALWRRGGAALRGLLLGGLATLLLLLPSHEWYGGGSPPLRYLTPALPGLALALAALGGSPRPARRAVWLVLPPTLMVWWVFATRPHLAFNPGDGGWWLGDALARRFACDSRALYPSFLVPTGATLWVPLGIVALGALLCLAGHRRPAAWRTLARLAVPLWLLLATGWVATLNWRPDRVVELEAAQVVRHGGLPEPPPGTFSRFLHVNGWRLRGGEAVSVPLRLVAGASLELEVMGSGELLAQWEGGGGAALRVAAPAFARLPLPPPPGPGRRVLHLRLEGEGEVVLDRLEVRRP